MLKISALAVLLLIAPTVTAAERNVHFTGDFESGKIQSKKSKKDGFFVHTLPNPQSGKKSVSSGSGGFAASTKHDTRVVPSDTVGKENVKPRAGRYFVRSALDRKKNYSELNGGKDKPRSKIYVAGDGNTVAFDEEGYLGFSLYLPKNLEHESLFDGSRGSTKVLQVQSDGSSNILLILSVYVPKGKSESHWLLQHLLDDGRKSQEIHYDLGSVKGDLGKWTDFVLRYRFNPFSKKTNAASVGGKDKVYQGNKGILQLWKAEGAPNSAGNREMALTKVNLVDQPVGRIPHKKSEINWHFRVYKGNWKNKPSSIKGPIWVGFDEIRDGRVVKDGTTYADVHPGGLACTNRCPPGSMRVASTAAPEPDEEFEDSATEAPPKAPVGLVAGD